MTSPHLDLVRSIYADWERGDFSRTDWAHPDIEYVEVTEGPEPGTWTGLAEAAKTVGDRLSMWEDFAPRAEEFRQLDDERVLVLQSYRGRAKGSGVKLDDIAPEGAHLFEIRDGKVTRLVIYTDRNRAFADLGLQV
jgi:ketosteroid isomerase-like protein